MMKSPKTVLAALALGSTIMVGCASTPPSNSELDATRDRLTALQNDAELSSRAPVGIEMAERAVRSAERAVEDRADKDVVDHRIYLANNRIEQARSEAERRLAEDRVQELGDSRAQTILDARTREAERLREELNARQTERGMVVTLGDVLFETGKADLRSGARTNLDKLAQFLREYEDRTIRIEGHTDSTGSDAINRRLSQQRADSVRDYLVSSGINGSRITAVGRSKDYPVADNSTAAGRQQNRRVEIIFGS